MAGILGCKPSSSSPADQEERLELDGIKRQAAPYFDLFRQRLKAEEEMAEILSRVRDFQSMKMVQLELKEKFPRFEAIGAQAKALPAPDPDVVAYLQARFEDGMRSAQARTRQEIQRIKQLPGGPEFLNNLNWHP